MIHRLTIENFGSIREAQTIELALPRTTPDLPRFRTSLFETRLPTVVALFGANASGKSTVLSAMSEVLEFAADSFPPTNPPRQWFKPFRTTGWDDRPTRIVIDFDGKWLNQTAELFRYELIFLHDRSSGDQVDSESLRVRRGARFQALFRRDKNGIRVGSGLGLTKADKRLDSVSRDTSLVSTMAMLNNDFFWRLKSDLLWVPKRLFKKTRENSTTLYVLRYLQNDRKALERLRRELRRLDVGLDDMDIKEGPDGQPYAVFLHDGLDAPLYFEEESEGTRHFLQMFPHLFITLDEGRPALIDEFDADLHPQLAAEIISWFHDPERNKLGAQLFLTSHNMALMDELEKEEIFLVEKGPDGASRIKPVRDFEGLRRDQSLARKYQGGVLGAVPNIG